MAAAALMSSAPFGHAFGIGTNISRLRHRARAKKKAIFVCLLPHWHAAPPRAGEEEGGWKKTQKE
jgi:hypothetical protein